MRTTCQYVVAYDIDPTFANETKEEIVKAADAWTEATGRRFCYLHVESKEKTMFYLAARGTLHFQQAFSPQEMCLLSGSRKDCENDVGIWLENRRSVYMYDSVKDRRWAIASHEIGHSLNLDHDESPDSLMRATITNVPEGLALSHAIPLRDRQAFFRIWGDR